MKIGIDARAALWYRGTGIGTYTYQLVKSLQNVDSANEYSLFWPGETDPDFLQPNARVSLDHVGESKDRFWEEVNLAARLAGQAIDVYHVPQNGIGLPAKLTCPAVVTIHDLIPYVYPETVGKGYLRLFLAEMPRIVDQARVILTVSHHSRKDIMRYFNVPADRIHVTYLAPEEIYQPLPQAESRQYIADKFGLPGEYVLYLGGFSPRKNVTGLIRAFAQMRRELGRPVYLVIAGKQTRSFDELVSTAERCNIADAVRFPGFIPLDDMPALYAGASLFVYPSFYEGFGLPPLEAMACGTPVVASDVSSLPEVLSGAAWLIDPHQPAQLAEAMYAVLTDEATAALWQERGLRHVRAFSWTRTAWETVRAYSEAAA